jgi:hypothetical protein
MYIKYSLKIISQHENQLKFNYLIYNVIDNFIILNL